VYRGLIVEWLRWIKEGYEPLLPERTYIHADDAAAAALKSLYGAPAITADIENIPGAEIVTIVGVSNGEIAVSVQWQNGNPGPKRLVQEVIGSAGILIGHNVIDHDIPRLKKEGFTIPDQVFDTYLASGVVRNQFRHGLQICVANELPVPPWKTVFQAAQAARTGAKSYTARFWTEYPEQQREYNTMDAFCNHLLAGVYYPRVFGRALP
jgi:hypothetical protein